MLEINFGQRIRDLRCKSKWSQLQLELEADFCPGTISRLENNKINPSKETLFRIGAALQLEVKDAIYLFGLDRLGIKVESQLPFEFAETARE